ncbi:MAG: aminotransferase class I/II-fold pyridoxal phosphate-dependent enzyme [Oscillospiraceae bacterium]|nr:aminotransferase class I/II-fold pyridoxal phosphate-dependent enzyme [Oscillospiraceae bacterium]
MTDRDFEKTTVWSMLSEYGKRVRFLTDGVLGQTWEARKSAYTFNATLGEYKEHGKDTCVQALYQNLKAFDPADVCAYAQPGGLPRLRQLWKAKMLQENPMMQSLNLSLPLVCAGLTHGLSLVGEMFLNPDDPVILHDMHWENYELIFHTRSGGRIVHYPTFRDGGFNVGGLRESILAEPSEKQLVVLNFPNNPTGYMLSPEEALHIREVLLECAEAGKKLVVLCDDAYYGFWYADGILTESIFGFLTGLHPNILTIRLDGATKEYFAGGLRMGFLTYGGQEQETLNMLEKKTMGAIRISVSSSSRLSQAILISCLESEEITAELEQKKASLRHRGQLVLDYCKKGSAAGLWEAAPFRSGFFICIYVNTNAQLLRRHLLDHYGIGIIALGDGLIRIALPCMEESEICTLFGLLDQAIAETEAEYGKT